MAGRDLSKELFGETQPVGRDLSAELFGESSGDNANPLTRTEKYLQGVKDPINAGAQLLTNMLPEGVVNTGNQLNNWIAEKTGLLGKVPEGGVNQMISDEEKEYQARRASGGEQGIDAYRLVGNIINPVTLAAAARTPQAATLLGKTLIGAGSGGIVSGITNPVTTNQDDFWKEKAKQTGLGMAFGGAIPVLGAGLSRVVSPKASTNPQLQLLKESGVNPTIGQTLGGWANKAEEKLQSLPIMGDAISAARNRSNKGFETAVYNKTLEKIGDKLPQGLGGRDALIYTENALKTNYDDVLNKIGAIKKDQIFTSKVDSLKSMVNKLVMPKAEKAKFASALNDVEQSMNKTGFMTSDAYKAIESQLGKDASKLGASTNIYEGKMSTAVKQLQEELRDLLKRNAGGYADDLQKTNAGWASFKRAQNAASKLGAEDGAFTPSQYLNAVRALDKSKDKGAFARGSALGQELGDAGKTILANKVPDSGTAQRVLYGTGAVASGAINPAIPIGLFTGAGAYLSPVQKLLSGSVTKRPESAVQLAELIRKYSTAVAPAGGIAGLNFVNNVNQ